MRVGFLTSWRVPCGVYQYTSRLAEAMDRQPDTKVVILAGRADEHRSVPEESDLEVHDVAKIGLWRDDGRYVLHTSYIHTLDLDVVHVQYQSMLFRAVEDLSRIKLGPGADLTLAATYHDNCVAPDFPYDAFDLHFSHRWNVGPLHLPNSEVLPFGIEDRPPVVRSFGLGRTRSDLIAPICERRGWIYESAASHEPIHGGGQSWKSHRELMEWLRGADAIVLWYDDVSAAGSSQAARTALATRRPVITNDSTWFSDLPDHVTKTYTKVHDLEALESSLSDVFQNSYLEQNSWDKVARMLLERYSRVRAVA